MSKANRPLYKDAGKSTKKENKMRRLSVLLAVLVSYDVKVLGSHHVDPWTKTAPYGAFI